MLQRFNFSHGDHEEQREGLKNSAASEKSVVSR